MSQTVRILSIAFLIIAIGIFGNPANAHEIEVFPYAIKVGYRTENVGVFSVNGQRLQAVYPDATEWRIFILDNDVSSHATIDVVESEFEGSLEQNLYGAGYTVNAVASNFNLEFSDAEEYHIDVVMLLDDGWTVVLSIITSFREVNFVLPEGSPFGEHGRRVTIVDDAGEYLVSAPLVDASPYIFSFLEVGDFLSLI